MPRRYAPRNDRINGLSAPSLVLNVMKPVSLRRVAHTGVAIRSPFQTTISYSRGGEGFLSQAKIISCGMPSLFNANSGAPIPLKTVAILIFLFFLILLTRKNLCVYNLPNDLLNYIYNNSISSLTVHMLIRNYDGKIIRKSH